MRRITAFSIPATIAIVFLLICSCDEDVTRVEPEQEVEEGEIIISIDSPMGGELLDEPTVVLVEVASDYDIESVDLFIDGTPVQRATDPPYEFIWYVGFWAQEKQHALQAKAVDINGKSVFSETVEVEVDTMTLAKPITCCPVTIICCPTHYIHTLKWLS